MTRTVALLVCTAGLLASGGCAPPPENPAESLWPPVGSGAMAPSLSVDGEDLLLSWLEPGHRFLVSRLHDEQWGEPVVIAEGNDFFANWADVPGVAVARNGSIWAHWLAKLGEGTYAYGISLARSGDGGRSWEPMGRLHDDASHTEHGFVSWARENEGLRAVWLDGREMADGGDMALRTARVGERVEPSQVLDDRVCECCPTALASTGSSIVALYRDRSESEIRNIGVARLEQGVWEAPRALHEDGWRIAGCPVNGPAIDADGDRIAVAWFTAEGDRPRVQLTFSNDGGERFSVPQTVDAEGPLGRVDLALGADGEAWVTWLAVVEEGAEVRLARFDESGRLEEHTLASSEASRASGIPRVVRVGESLYIAWVEAQGERPSSIGVARLDLS